MLSLTRARYVTGTAGESLPSPFRTLEEAGVTLNRGELSLVAAAPGGGKSVFAMVVAIRVGVPSLYWAADTPVHQMYLRVAAHLGGRSVGDIKHAVHLGHTERITEQLRKLDHLRWEFASRIEADRPEGDPRALPPLWERLEAFTALYGEYPRLLIVDNIKNFHVGGEHGDELNRYRAATEYLNHEVARKIGAHVMALHHVTGAYNDGNQYIPLSGVKGQLSDEASLVLTLHRDNAGAMFVHPAKNRNGAADGRIIQLRYDPERMLLEDR